MIYKKLGGYIELVDRRNTGSLINDLRGLSLNKRFRKSTSNIHGTDLSKYKIMLKNDFSANFMGLGVLVDKVAIVLKEDEIPNIVSAAYPVFRINCSDLLSEFLFLWFKRSEFDRYCVFKSDSGIRGGFGWEELCEVELPVPSIEKQREIVAQYQAVANKIKVNEQICEKLEATAQALYKHWFVDFEFPNEEGKPYKSSGGKMVWNEELEKEIPESWEVGTLKEYATIKGGKRLPKDSELNKEKSGRPYIRVADMNKNKFLTINSEFMFVDDVTQKEISRYTVDTNDVIISIVGTIGLVNVVDESLDKANLTENCFKLTNLRKINKDFLYQYLISENGQREIEMKTVGGVQAKLPMYNVELLDLIVPTTKLLSQFESTIKAINGRLILIIRENDKLTQLQSLLLSRLATLEG